MKIDDKRVWIGRIDKTGRIVPATEANGENNWGFTWVFKKYADNEIKRLQKMWPNRKFVKCNIKIEVLD